MAMLKAFWAETARRCTTREIEKMVVYTPGGGLPPISRGERAHTGGAVISCKKEPTMKREAPPVNKDERSEGRSSMAATEADAINGEGVEERSTRYHDKLIIDISGEQMAVVKDAFAKARKESGLKDRASLIAFIARAYVEGTSEAQGTRSKPPYQIVIHHHPESGRSWCESLKGEHYLPDSTFSKALCDAEIVEMREDTTGPCRNEGTILSEGNSGGSEEPPAQSPTVGLPEPDHGNDRLVSFINTLYAGHKGKKNGACGCEKHENLSGVEIHRCGNHTVPRKLRREVMLRDEHSCQAPGCGRRLFLVIHHIVPMACGGMTIKAHMLVLCWQCHDLVHMGWLGVSGEAPSKLIWRDKEGRILCQP